ncbi:hypothetical protein [Candidatus Vondammii sp. HM_W22]|uniref:hypothetical protein n=1 Tax=Candidatus Vondammii sp. HM_W22 TaxID=2687299 RepID=UPI001F12F1C7|nr:hypothetical protein [Candidatus Vondammii sp. HM_W22]
MIDKKELQAAANHIKTEEDHNEFRQMLDKITVDAVLNKLNWMILRGCPEFCVTIYH